VIWQITLRGVHQKVINQPSFLRLSMTLSRIQLSFYLATKNISPAHARERVPTIASNPKPAPSHCSSVFHSRTAATARAIISRIRKIRFLILFLAMLLAPRVERLGSDALPALIFGVLNNSRHVSIFLQGQLHSSPVFGTLALDEI
jgi:hypothetical protein